MSTPVTPPPSPYPTMGRVVLVTFDKALHASTQTEIVTRPADVITPFPGEPYRCNVLVKLDGPNDGNTLDRGRGQVPTHKWLGAVPHDPEGKAVPSWRYPPRS